MLDTSDTALVSFALLILYIAIKDVIRPLIDLRTMRNGDGARANGNGTIKIIEVGALVRQANEQLSQLMQELKQNNELIRQLLIEQRTHDHDLKRSIEELLRELTAR
ncbi:MAG: hypothetical protein AAF495_20115 [Pseudomonadota bacterium]